MAGRTKPYYTKSQTTEGLFTEGKHLMLEDGTEYIGMYHQYFDGGTMTLASYDKLYSRILVPFRDVTQPMDEILLKYDSLNELGSVLKKHTGPISYWPKLELSDYRRGWFERYFIKRTNDINARVIEIHNEDFSGLSEEGSGIDGSLYHGISLRWKLTGPILDTDIEKGVVDSNKRTVQRFVKQMPGLDRVLGNFQEFSVHGKLIDQNLINNL